MESCKFEIRYTACSVDICGKKVNHRFTFCTNSFERFTSYYRYLRYGGVRRVSRVRSIRIRLFLIPVRSFSFPWLIPMVLLSAKWGPML